MNANSDLDTTLSPVLGDGKILYKGKYGNSLYEPHDMFNSVKNETIAVNLDANNLNTDDSVVSAIIDENPLHFNYWLYKIINFKYKELAYSGIAAALIVGLFINGFFSDSNSFKEAEILDYMNYELVDYSNYDYIELFDVNEFEINFNQLDDNDFEYYLETSFSDDQNLNNE